MSPRREQPRTEVKDETTRCEKLRGCCTIAPDLCQGIWERFESVTLSVNGNKAELKCNSAWQLQGWKPDYRIRTVDPGKLPQYSQFFQSCPDVS